MWKEKEKARPGWRYIQKYKDVYTGKMKRVSVYMESDRKKDERAAAILLEEKIRERNSLSPRIESGLTFGVLVDRYLEWQLKTNKYQSYINAVGHFNTLKRVIGSDVLMERLDREYLLRALWKNDDTKKNPAAGQCSPVTFNGRVKRIKALIRWAYQSDILPDSRLADKISYMKIDKKEESLLYMEPEEYGALLDAMTVLKWKYLSRLMLLTGCRIGEAIALSFDDIDRTGEVLRISRTWSMNIHDVSSVKTAASVRDIPIQDELMSFLDEVFLWRRKEGIDKGKLNLIVPGEYGQYCQYESYEKYLRETSEKVLGRRITSHRWRHTHISMMAAAGVDLETITRRVGHNNSKITREIYLHITDEQRRKDAAAVRDVRLENWAEVGPESCKNM